MNLTDQLDLAIGPPLPDQSPLTYVAAGRRRRRRRLAGVGAAAMAVVVVAGLVLGQPHRDAAPPIAQEASTSTAPTPATAPATGASAAADYAPADGRLVVQGGWTVTRQVASPYVEPPDDKTGLPDRSVALELTDGTTTQWALLFWYAADGGEAGATWDDDVTGFGSFEDWLDFRLAVETTTSTDQAVAFGPDGRLEPRNGAVLTAQGPVDLGDGGQAAAARIDLLGNQWWILARMTADGATYVPVAYPFVGDPDTVAGFERHVRTLIGRGEL